MGLFKPKTVVTEDELNDFTEAFYACIDNADGVDAEGVEVDHTWLHLKHDRRATMEKGKVVVCLQTVPTLFPDNKQWKGTVEKNMMDKLPAAYVPLSLDDAEFALVVSTEAPTLGRSRNTSTQRFTALYIIHRPTVTLSRTQSLTETISPTHEEDGGASQHVVYHDTAKAKRIFAQFFKVAG